MILPSGEMRKVWRAGELHVAHGLDGDAVLIDHLVVGVGEELEGESFLGAELPCGESTVSSETPTTAALRAVYFALIALEVVGFNGAALGLILGVEVEDDVLALEVREAYGFVKL